jgi:hypothetical protein
MANDPGLSGDTCIYMEAVAGDGGVHNGSGVWWLSPDIQLTGPTSGPDKADPGAVNPVTVTARRKSDDSNCILPPATESITIQLWVGNPSLAMAPNNPDSTTLIDSIGIQLIGPGTSYNQVFNWTPPTGLPPNDPQSPGHKCLIARSYPDPLTPSATSFYVPDDQHVAQRNICIVPCGGPGAARRPGPCGLDVTTLNVNPERAEAVTLRAVADLHPDKHVQRVVLEHLNGTPGFKRIATAPPVGFEFQLDDFPDAKISDRTRSGCLGRLIAPHHRPTYEAQIRFEPKQSTRFTFSADMSRASFGDAYIFHLTQVGADGRDQGGLTVVTVAV